MGGAGHRLLLSEEQPRRTKFPPITPMDLLDESSESQPTTKGSHSALESVSTAMSDSCSECSQDEDEDDMELEVEDLVSSALVRPPYEMEAEADAGAEAELSFGALGPDESLLQSHDSEGGIMRVGDLEMVREEAESDYSKLDEALDAQSQSETRRSYQQIQIGNKLAKLKSRGKQRRAR